MTGAPPLEWLWFEQFDNMYGRTAKINGVPKGVHQGVRLQYTEVHELCDDHEAPKSLAASDRAAATKEATKCPQVDRKVKKKYTPK